MLSAIRILCVLPLAQRVVAPIFSLPSSNDGFFDLLEALHSPSDFLAFQTASDSTASTSAKPLAVDRSHYQGSPPTQQFSVGFQPQEPLETHENRLRTYVRQHQQGLPLQNIAGHEPQPPNLDPVPPLQHASWEGFRDRDPDDLSAVVFGRRTHPGHPIDKIPEALGATIGDGVPDQPEGLQVLHEPGPNFQSRESHVQPSTYEVPAASQLLEAEPLTLSGMPVMIQYLEDRAIDAVVNQIKDLLNINQKSRVHHPRPLRSRDPHDFMLDINRYMRQRRLHKELYVSGRRVYVNYMYDVRKTSQSLTDKGLIVWELKTNGERAFMVCRGIYALNPSFWPTIRSIKMSQPYMISIDTSTTTHPGILHVNIGPSDKLDADQSGLNAMPMLPKGDQQVSFPQFLYRPIRGLEPLFRQWLYANLGKAYKFQYEAERFLNAGEESVFSARMSAAFKHRIKVRLISINGRPFLWTHHIGNKAIKSLPKRYTILWEQAKDDANNDVLVAIGIFPMTRLTYGTAAKKAQAPEFIIQFKTLPMQSKVKATTIPGSSMSQPENGQPSSDDSWRNWGPQQFP